MAKIIECCETCDRWIRVNMPMNVGLCYKSESVHCGSMQPGDGWCSLYKTEPKLLKPARSRRKRGAEDGKTE